MARRAGGYRKSDPTEWAECARAIYGEAIVSANLMGQDVYVWMNDAIQHHVYRCEALKAQELYRADCEAHLRGELKISPQQWEDKYQVKRPKPEITRPAGQGSTPGGRSYRP